MDSKIKCSNYSVYIQIVYRNYEYYGVSAVLLPTDMIQSYRTTTTIIINYIYVGYNINYSIVLSMAPQVLSTNPLKNRTDCVMLLLVLRAHLVLFTHNYKPMQITFF